MNEAPESAAAPAVVVIPARPRVALPTASTILRISAAPKSISERHVLAMARELTGSRAFPRSRVVTALDYVRALSSSSTRVVVVDEEDQHLPISLGPDDAEEARRLADLALGDASFPPRRPCALACAVVSLALMSRSSSTSASDAVVRRCVHRSVLGRGAGDPGLVQAARAAESDLRVLRSAPSSRDAGRSTAAPPAAHLIPLEDD